MKKPVQDAKNMLTDKRPVDAALRQAANILRTLGYRVWLQQEALKAFRAGEHTLVPRASIIVSDPSGLFDWSEMFDSAGVLAPACVINTAVSELQKIKLQKIKAERGRR